MCGPTTLLLIVLMQLPTNMGTGTSTSRHRMASPATPVAILQCSTSTFPTGWAYASAMPLVLCSPDEQNPVPVYQV